MADDEVTLSIKSDGTAVGTQLLVDGKMVSNPVTRIEMTIDADTGVVSAVLNVEMVSLDLDMTLYRREAYVNAVQRGKSPLTFQQLWAAIEAAEEAHYQASA